MISFTTLSRVTKKFLTSAAEAVKKSSYITDFQTNKKPLSANMSYLKDKKNLKKAANHLSLSRCERNSSAEQK